MSCVPCALKARSSSSAGGRPTTLCVRFGLGSKPARSRARAHALALDAPAGRDDGGPVGCGSRTARRVAPSICSTVGSSSSGGDLRLFSARILARSALYAGCVTLAAPEACRDDLERRGDVLRAHPIRLRLAFFLTEAMLLRGQGRLREFRDLVPREAQFFCDLPCLGHVGEALLPRSCGVERALRHRRGSCGVSSARDLAGAIEEHQWFPRHSPAVRCITRLFLPRWDHGAMHHLLVPETASELAAKYAAYFPKPATK